MLLDLEQARKLASENTSIRVLGLLKNIELDGNDLSN